MLKFSTSPDIWPTKHMLIIWPCAKGSLGFHLHNSDSYKIITNRQILFILPLEYLSVTQIILCMISLMYVATI